MHLTPEHKKAVSAWIAAGASISDVQKRLRDELKISLTYIDTRFLIDDLGLEIKSPPAPKVAPRAADLGGAKAPGAAAPDKPAPMPRDADAELVDDGDAFAAGADEFADDVAPAPAAPAGAAGNVSVEVDRLTRPGAVVSGTVKFSDGNSGKWALDQYGRLVFEGATQGYRPSPADLQAFQRELSAQLQRHGY
jgi:hypothetical protein